MRRGFLILYIWACVSMAVAQVSSPEIVDQTTGTAEAIRQAVFGWSGKWIAVWGGEGPILIYDVGTARLARTINVNATEIAAHPSRNLLAVSGREGISLIDVMTGQTLWQVTPDLKCGAIHFSSDGTNIYSGCSAPSSGWRFGRAYVKTWDTDTARELSSTARPEGVSSIAICSADCEWYAALKMPEFKDALKTGFKDALRSAIPGKGISGGETGDAHTILEYRILETSSGRQIGTVHAERVLAVSAKARRAIAVSSQGILLCDIDTGKNRVIGGSGSATATISPDGSRALLVGADLRIVDLASGDTKQVAVSDLPASMSAAIASDNDQVAILAVSPNDSILLFSLAHPEQRRMIGKQEGVVAVSDAWKKMMESESLSSHPTRPTKEDERLIREYESRILRAKGSERQRLQTELDSLLNKDQEAREQSEAELGAQYQQSMAKFGGITMVPPAAAFLDSGRLLAVRAADMWWDIWDSTTGNRMPFRKPPGSLRKYSTLETLLDLEELREFESSITGREAQASAIAPGQKRTNVHIACSSEDGLYYVEIAQAKGRVQSAVLRSDSDDRSVNLVAWGIDVSSWNTGHSRVEEMVEGTYSRSGEHGAQAETDIDSANEAIKQFTESPRVCRLSRDGALLIVEWARPDLHTSDRSRVSKFFRPDYSPKSTSDSLVVFNTRTGRKACELESDSGNAPIDVLLDELRFSPDGSLIAGGGGPVNEYQQSQPRTLRIWDGATCKLLHTVPRSGGPALGFSSDGGTLVTAMEPQPYPSIDVYGLRLWNTSEFRTGAGAAGSPRSVDIPDAVASVKLMLIGPNGNIVIAPDRTHALGMWDRNTGDRIGTLRALQEGEWLVTTPEGFFDGSPRGWTTLAWHDSKSDLATKPVEIFFNEFYRPGLLSELLEGRRPQGRRSLSQLDRRQPTISIAAQAPETTESTIVLDIGVEEAPASAGSPTSSGIRDLRLFRNGSLVKAWRGDLALRSGRATLHTTAPLVAGENRFVAYAFNRDNVKSADAATVVRSLAPAKPAIAYVLAIGVNRYANPEFNLTFATPDAKRFMELLCRRYTDLGKFSKVVQVGLYDEQATRANVLLALARLAGQRETALPSGVPPQLLDLRAAEPQDSVVIYFAGHGIASGDRFYLIPHDLGYAGSRADLRQSLDRILRASISDQDLDQAFETIDATSPILIIDACNSGQALEAKEQRRGPLNSKGLAQLAYEKGMYVLTASQAYQAALESSRLGHGYLTFALVEEGLNSPAADVSPADGEVTVTELFEYAARRVPQLQIEALDKAARDGRALTFDGAAEHGGAPSRLQTPRLYYRRDNSEPPPVVWKR